MSKRPVTTGLLAVLAVLASLMCQASASAQAPGLVAAYGFEEGTGTNVGDVSGNHNTGVLGSGVTRTTAGKYGGALVFSGSGFVTVADAASLDLTTAMTLEAWVFPTVTPTNWTTVLMKEQPDGFVYVLYAGSPANRPGLFYNVSTSSSGERGVVGPSALPLNVWSHLAGAFDGATLRLYVNGALVASQAFAGPMATSSGALRIGGNGVWSEYFMGRIDEVRIYGRALSLAEIQADMNAAVGAANTAPTTTSIADQVVSEDTAAGPMSFTVNDAETAPENLMVSGSSSNTTLVPNGSIVLGGSGATRTVTVTPAARRTGAATITVTVSDGELNTNTSFLLTVTGLVAAYGFDEGGGATVVDASGNDNTGTIAHATWTTDGKYGNALLFNGSNAWVVIGNAPSISLTTGMTLEAWVNPVSLPPLGCSPAATCSWMDVIHKDSDRYYIEANSNLNQTPEAGGIFASGKHVVFAPSALPLATWTHLALTYDSQTIRFYVNGSLVASSPETAPITTSTNPLFIGGDQTMGQFFNGRIDEVRIYTRALSPAEVQTDMNTAVGATTAAPRIGPAAGDVWLGPALPNPAHGSALLRFRIERQGEIHLAIFSNSGRRLRTLARGQQTAGEHAFRWDGLNDRGETTPAGVYLVLLESQGEVASRKIIWLGP